MSQMMAGEKNQQKNKQLQRSLLSVTVKLKLQYKKVDGSGGKRRYGWKPGTWCLKQCTKVTNAANHVSSEACRLGEIKKQLTDSKREVMSTLGRPEAASYLRGVEGSAASLWFRDTAASCYTLQWDNDEHTGGNVFIYKKTARSEHEIWWVT